MDKKEKSKAERLVTHPMSISRITTGIRYAILEQRKKNESK